MTTPNNPQSVPDFPSNGLPDKPQEKVTTKCSKCSGQDFYMRCLRCHPKPILPADYREKMGRVREALNSGLYCCNSEASKLSRKEDPEYLSVVNGRIFKIKQALQILDELMGGSV